MKHNWIRLQLVAVDSWDKMCSIFGTWALKCYCWTIGCSEKVAGVPHTCFSSVVYLFRRLCKLVLKAQFILCESKMAVDNSVVIQKKPLSQEALRKS